MMYKLIKQIYTFNNNFLGGNAMTIKEASEITGISIDNLRYYERIGLMPEVPRTASGIREYDEASISWIEFAMHFKRGGMPLESIREYIQLALTGEETKPARKIILLETKEQLEKKFKEIKESLEVINYKLEIYDQKCEPITIKMVKEWREKNNK